MIKGCGIRFRGDEDISPFHESAVKGYLMWHAHPARENHGLEARATFCKKAITRSFSLRVTAVSACSGVLLI
jgi:hypothetical protein